MNLIDTEEWKLLTEFAIGGGIKLLFLLFGLVEYCLYKNMGKFTRSTFSWTNSFFVKMSFNFLLSINYAAFALTLGNWHYLFFFNSFAWLISCGLLYFEYIRKLQQSWLSLRLFWFINGLFYLGKISYFFYSYLYPTDARGDRTLKLLYCYFIQSVPSLFLMAFSVFKPSDSDLLHDLDATDESENVLKSSFISDISSKQAAQALVTVTITEHWPGKYEMRNNVLIPITTNRTKAEDIRLKFKVRFHPNKTYIIKKNLFEIIAFNCLLIESESKHLKKSKCSSMIQLKNLTNIFMKNANALSKLKELQTVYSNLCEKHSFALTEFLKFCEVADEKLKANLLSRFDELKKSEDLLIGNKDSNKEIDSEAKNNNDFFSDIDDNYGSLNKNNLKGMESNDIIKTSNYIYSIINKEQPQRLVIQYVNEKPKLNDSEIICEINSAIPISIPWKNLITLINHSEKLKKTSTILSLKEIVKDGMNLNHIKKEGNPIRASIESIFNEMINNLMYLDYLLFSMFDLNKIIKLDVEEIDMDIINSYFELDFFSSMKDPLHSVYCSNPKCSIESIKYYSSCPECNNDIALKIRVRVSTEVDRKWDTVICLNEMYLKCNEVILLNTAFQRFNSLSFLLSSIMETLKEVIKGYNATSDEEWKDCFGDDQGKVAKEINLLSNEENKDEGWSKHLHNLSGMMNQLLSKNHFYIFYTPFFRKAFGIDQFDKDTETYHKEGLFNMQLEESNKDNDGDNCNDSFSNNDSFYENLIG